LAGNCRKVMRGPDKEDAMAAGHICYSKVGLWTAPSSPRSTARWCDQQRHQGNSELRLETTAGSACGKLWDAQVSSQLSQRQAFGNAQISGR
jgi:hypothetical protein